MFFTVTIKIRNRFTIFREEDLSTLDGFLAGLLFWLNWNLEMLVFVERGKPENPKKTLGARREPTINLTHT